MFEILAGTLFIVGSAAMLVEKGKELVDSVKENGLGDTVVNEEKKAYNSFSKTVKNEYKKQQREQAKREQQKQKSFNSKSV